MADCTASSGVRTVTTSFALGNSLRSALNHKLLYVCLEDPRAAHRRCTVAALGGGVRVELEHPAQIAKEGQLAWAVLAMNCLVLGVSPTDGYERKQSDATRWVQDSLLLLRVDLNFVKAVRECSPAWYEPLNGCELLGDPPPPKTGPKAIRVDHGDWRIESERRARRI